MDDRKFEQSSLTTQIVNALTVATKMNRLDLTREEIKELILLFTKIRDEKLDIRLVSREY